MKCQNCGADLVPNAVFCASCGSKVQNMSEPVFNGAPVIEDAQPNTTSAEINYTYANKFKKKKKTAFVFMLVSIFFVLICIASSSTIAVAGMISFIVSFFVYGISKQKYKDACRVAEYGDVEELRATILNNAVYKSNDIVLSPEYLMSTTNKFVIIKNDEILALYNYVHKTNGFTDGTALIAIDKYGEKVKFEYSTKRKNEIPPDILRVKVFAPKAAIGYSIDTLKYIEINKLKK